MKENNVKSIFRWLAVPVLPILSIVTIMILAAGLYKLIEPLACPSDRFGSGGCSWPIGVQPYIVAAFSIPAGMLGAFLFVWLPSRLAPRGKIWTARLAFVAGVAICVGLWIELLNLGHDRGISIWYMQDFGVRISVTAMLIASCVSGFIALRSESIRQIH